jgi:hypothetical protein
MISCNSPYPFAVILSESIPFPIIYLTADNELPPSNELLDEYDRFFDEGTEGNE